MDNAIARRLVVAGMFVVCASAALADATASRPFQSAVARQKVQRVVIDIPAASISIRNGDANTIGISGVISREYDGPSDRAKAQKIVDATSVGIYVSNDEAVVRPRFGPAAKGWRGETFNSFEVTVTVPPGLSLEIGTRYGELAIEGTFGNIDVDLRAGEIKLRTPRNAVRELNASCRVGEVHANLGDEVIKREGVLPGKTHFVNAQGKGLVNLHVTAGEIDVELTR